MKILPKTYRVRDDNIKRIKFLHRRVSFLVKFQLYKIIRKHSSVLKNSSLQKMEMIYSFLDKLFSLYHD